MKIPDIKGGAAFQTDKSLEEAGEIISKKLFGGLEFQGKELSIYEEVPAIFIKNQILGLSVILNGYSGYGEDERFILEIRVPYFNDIFGNNVESYKYDISKYLEGLLEDCFKEDKTVKILKSK
ncbi:hypothetical protein NNC19_12760 [Clostridium sp. SHJSY1]|uniref:hypothetical protein n=1 Tax=Clostridium sp. SHJSY1 TaxID=2942483 RepID=UPI0028758954|nr:hypothetical protein [Clostridium sp. SHJSY1]MDS0526555.1 hypothetical protein [Clostridium sp. SHJSY1]